MAREGQCIGRLMRYLTPRVVSLRHEPCARHTRPIASRLASSALCSRVTPPPPHTHIRTGHVHERPARALPGDPLGLNPACGGAAGGYLHALQHGGHSGLTPLLQGQERLGAHIGGALCAHVGPRLARKTRRAQHGPLLLTAPCKKKGKKGSSSAERWAKDGQPCRTLSRAQGPHLLSMTHSLPGCHEFRYTGPLLAT